MPKFVVDFAEIACNDFSVGGDGSFCLDVECYVYCGFGH